MKLTITNVGPIAVPIMEPTVGNSFLSRLGRDRGAPWMDMLEPGVAFNLDQGISVALIGDKPSVREQFERAHEVLSASKKALMEAYQNRMRPNMPTDNTDTVSATLQNNGTNAVRVILGDGVTDFNLAPGAIQDATAQGYLELRELGLVNPNINTQPSSAA